MTEKSACDTCPKPGVCCKEFILNRYFDIARPIQDQWEETQSAQTRRLPFYPIREVKTSAGGKIRFNPDGTKSENGTESIWIFGCKNISPSGRCMDYENRPSTCRVFEPSSNALCALHPDHGKIGKPHLEYDNMEYDK